MQRVRLVDQEPTLDLTTFADQAVIAIESVRLFDEIQEKSQQLAEASQHKSQFLANMSHKPGAGDFPLFPALIAFEPSDRSR